MFTIEVLNVNEPPIKIAITDETGQLSFLDDQPRVQENSSKGTVVGTTIAYDRDEKESLSFRLDGDANGRFALGPVTCKAVTDVPVSRNDFLNNFLSFFFQSAKTKCSAALLVSGLLDYETQSQHYITIRSTDSKGLFVARRFSVAVVDVNEPPQSIAVVGGSVDENLNNAIVASFTTSDSDSADKHTYSLTNSAGGLFVIQGANLMTSPNANLDYERQSQYTVVIRSTDSGSLFVERRLTVYVKDVNEAPSAASLKGNKVPENSAKGTVVGFLRGTDPDNAQKLTFTLIDAADDRFMIVNGLVKVAVSNTRCHAYGGSDCKLNYESAKSHTIIVRVTDSGSPAMSQDFPLTIFVTDQNDQPRNLEIDAFRVYENKPAGTLVGTFTATDEDAGDTLTYKLLDDDNGQFTLKGNQLLKAKSTNYETKVSHVIKVEVTDGAKSVSIV